LNTTKIRPEASTKRRRFNFLIKLTISAVALYFVFSKIDFQETLHTIASVNLLYFLLALLAFNLSKIVSAFRFKAFLKPLQIHLSNAYSIRLLYIGMFYNLFLPGSIGGDAYKVYLLKQENEVKVKHLVSASLLDRVSGLVLLLMMAGLFLMFSSFTMDFHWINQDILILIGVLLSVPAFFVLIRTVFPQFVSAFLSTSHHSFWVQAGQVLSALMLLFSLSVAGYYLDYLTLFMVSSVVAVLPFTIGGVGARELVFLYGVQYLNIEEEKAVTFAILFFIITAITSLIGLLFSGKDKV